MARVSLVRQGDPAYREWVGGNLERLGREIFRLRNKDLAALAPDLLQLADEEDYLGVLLLLVEQRPGAFKQRFYESLATHPEPEARRLAARHLKSEERLWVLAGDRRSDGVALASLVRLASKGDAQAVNELKRIARTVRASGDRSQYSWFLPEILELDDLSFLRDEADWLVPRYPTVRDPELLVQFLRRLRISDES